MFNIYLIMKKKNFLWSMLIIGVTAMLSVGFTSCKHDDPVLEVTSGATVNVDAAGGTNGTLITVRAEDTDWSVAVTQGADWLTAIKNGNSVQLTWTTNTTTATRMGIVTVTSTVDKSLSQAVSVIQAAASGNITVNGSSTQAFTFPGLFDSGIDYKQVFKVHSNVQWTLSGKPDWLNVSATSGRGDIDLTIYPTAQNTTDDERKATLTLSGDNTSASIEITQNAGKPVCYAIPANAVALHDRICWEYSATSNINEFQMILLSDKEYSRLTDNELLKELNQEEKLKFVDDYITSTGVDSHGNRITQNTTYWFVSIAYNENDISGALKKTKIKTPAFLDVDEDAWVSFENVQANLSSGFWFDAKKEGYCDKYHIIYGLEPEIKNPVLYAFQINYFIKYGKKHWYAENWDLQIQTNYPNNHTFTYPTRYLSTLPLCFAYGWGVFRDGKLSSDLVGFQWDTSSEETSRNNIRSSSIPHFTTITRSEERAKRMQR